jgi:hypothetical protein
MLCFVPYFYWFLEPPLQNRILRFSIVMTAVVGVYLYKYTTQEAAWKTEIRPDP